MTLLQAARVEGQAEVSLTMTKQRAICSGVALLNKFFAVVVAPVRGRSSTEPAQYLKAVKAVDLDQTKHAAPDGTSDITGCFITQTSTLGPGQVAAYPMEMLPGPQYGLSFSRTTVIQITWPAITTSNLASFNMGIRFITPKWLVSFMLGLLGMLEAVVGNYGGAIILMVLIVRGGFAPADQADAGEHDADAGTQRQAHAQDRGAQETLRQRQSPLAQEQMKLSGRRASVRPCR